MAAFAAAALFHWARALANAACPAGADADGVGDAVCPAEATAVAELAGVVAAVAAGDAVVVCCVLGAAVGALDPAVLQAATDRIVTSNTPVTGRNRSLVTCMVTREPGVWLGCLVAAREHRERLRPLGDQFVVGAVALGPPVHHDALDEDLVRRGVDLEQVHHLGGEVG